MTYPVAAPDVQARRSRELAAWHAQWSAGQVAKGVDGPVPEGRPAKSDWNQHVPDVESDGPDLDVFFAKANQIMGLTDTGASPVDHEATITDV